MRNKLRRLYSKPAIIGWISIILFIWKIIEALDTFKGVMENINAVWRFLSTPIGMLVLLFLGLVLIAYSVVRSEPNKINTNKVEPTQNAPSWLERIASQDLDNLSQRIKVEVRQIDFTGLNDVVPNLKLRIRLVNTSIFRVKLLRCDGYISLNGAHGTTPQLDSFPKLEHSAKQDIELTQTLEGQIPQMLRGLATTNAPVNVVGSMCHLVFQVISEGYNQQVEIPISEGGISCVPEGVRVVFGGNIGRVNS